MSPHKTAKIRDMHLRQAEALAQQADLLELEASAKGRAHHGETSRRGLSASLKAADLRQAAQASLCIVTELTDYSFPSDMEASSLRQRLQGLALANDLELSPREVASRIGNKALYRRREEARANA